MPQPGSLLLKTLVPMLCLGTYLWKLRLPPAMCRGYRKRWMEYKDMKQELHV